VEREKGMKGLRYCYFLLISGRRQIIVALWTKDWLESPFLFLFLAVHSFLFFFRARPSLDQRAEPAGATRENRHCRPTFTSWVGIEFRIEKEPFAVTINVAAPFGRPCAKMRGKEHAHATSGGVARTPCTSSSVLFPATTRSKRVRGTPAKVPRRVKAMKPGKGTGRFHSHSMAAQSALLFLFFSLVRASKYPRLAATGAME
jgi:hypothetical protein